MAARVLIADGQLNEAILLLERTIRRDPDRIDDAEALLNRIRTIRGQYNDLLERLIDHLNANPEDRETTLMIIAEMEALDQYPNQRIASQVRYARVIAQLAFDRSIAGRIMREAADLLAEERYLGAIERYLSGFTLQQPEHQEREYPALVNLAVSRAVNDLRTEADRFSERLEPLEESYSALFAAVRSFEFEGIESAVNRFVALHGEGSRSERVVASSGEAISDVRQTVPTMYPDDPVDWHLVFLQQFALGSGADATRDGILGSMELIRLRQQDRLSEEFTEAGQQIDRLARSSFEARMWPETAETYTNAANLARLAVIMASAGASPAIPPEQIDRALEELPRVMLVAYLRHHAGFQSAVFSVELAEALGGLDATLRRIDSAVDELVVRRSLLADTVGRVASIREEWRSAISVYPDDQILFVDRARETLSETTERVDTALAEGRTAEIETVRSIASLRMQALNRNLERNRAVQTSAVERIAGVETGTTGPGGQVVTVVLRYPAESLAELSVAVAAIPAIRTEATDFLETLETEVVYVRGDPEVSERIRELRAFLDRLSGLENDIAETVTEAEQRVALAAQLRNRGGQLATQTEQALGRLDVERARDLWEQARESYFESLEVQEDPVFRAQSDQQIVRLGVRLQEADNELIVQAVRRLIDRADTLYRQEEYRQARTVLDEARQTWERTNVDPNPEIERLNRFVTAALTMEGRRTLVQTEPLYPVLSNYLHLAQADYDRAQGLISTSGIASAHPFLARADENLSNVTAVRPYNWEARLLRLQILRLLESDNFTAIFENRVNEAWARRNEDPTEALVDLQALQAINPNYPGLTDRIIQLEIRLGIRPDPVTQAQIARSADLFRQAQALSAGAGAAQVRAAITILEEAVTLNPNNSQAKVLLDRLRIGSGGQAAVALSSADEQQFRRAETLFVEGNIAQAFAIVERLLQNENNRLYPPLLNLRQRIAGRLGIS